MEQDPFPGLKISSSDWLDDIKDRTMCHRCQKSRKYFCYTCFLPIQEIAGRFPTVKLPLKVDIIKHPQEVDGKSTAAHAAILAPDNVTVYTYPDIPVYTQPNKVLLLFPSKEAICLPSLARKVREDKNLSNLNMHKDGNLVFECRNKLKNCHLSATSTDKNSSSSESNKVKIYQNENLVQLITDKSHGDRNCDLEKRLRENTQEKTAAVKIKYKFNTGSSFAVASGNSETLRNDTEKIDSTDGGDKETNILSDVLRPRDNDNMCSSDINLSFSHIGQNNGSERNHLEKARYDCASFSPDLPFETVIFIDSTWNQTYKIISDERLNGLTCVEIQGNETKFWRHQRRSPGNFLSTIEAIYYFFREFHELFLPQEYKGEYDDLLFLFKYMYQKLSKLPGGREPIAYVQRREASHKPN